MIKYEEGDRRGKRMQMDRRSSTVAPVEVSYKEEGDGKGKETQVGWK